MMFGFQIPMADDLSAPDSRRGERVAVYRVQRLEMRGLELARGYATRQHSSESGNAGSKLSRSLNHILISICLYPSIYPSIYIYIYPIYTRIYSVEFPVVWRLSLSSVWGV